MYLGDAGLGYQPYKMGGQLPSTIKLKTLAGLSRAHVDGLGEIPVVVVKEEATATFADKMKGILPFAVTMFGVSVASSLTIYALTRLFEGKRRASSA